MNLAGLWLLLFPPGHESWSGVHSRAGRVTRKRPQIFWGEASAMGLNPLEGQLPLCIG
jgi:hypothetical protein